MKKKNKEELLRIIDTAFAHLLREINYKETRAKYEQARKEIVALIKNGVTEDWLPTPENINALPEPVRRFIHDLETNTDPAHIVRENILIKDTCMELLIKLREKKKKIIKSEEWLSDFLRCMPIYDAQPRKDYAKERLEEIGVEIVKK